MRKKVRPKRIEIVFPKAEAQGFAPQKSAMKNFVATVEEIRGWFERYDISSIELWISGAIETGGVLRLILSASGQGGILVTLKPKRKQS